MNIKETVKQSPLYPLLYPISDKIIKYNVKRQFRKEHWRIHNENQLFYTLSPELLIAIDKAFRIQGKDLLTGDYGCYEFGLFKGFSFWFAEQLSREYTMSGFHHYGFDSFEGMPQPIVEKGITEWSKGAYSASLESVEAFLKQNKTDFSRIQLFKGFFSDGYFKKLESKKKFRLVSICVIDSDLYESCVSALEFIGKYLVSGSILIFDDFNLRYDNEEDNDKHGERRALLEYEEKHLEFQKEWLFDYNPCGVVFRIK